MICILSIGSRTKPVCRKTLVGNFWSVGEFVDNKLTDGFRDGQSAKKKLIHFIPTIFPSGSLPYKQQKYHMQFHWCFYMFVGISVGKYNISPMKYHLLFYHRFNSTSDICNNSFPTLWNIPTDVALQSHVVQSSLYCAN